jgi:hypothetical protein
MRAKWSAISNFKKNKTFNLHVLDFRVKICYYLLYYVLLKNI